MMKTFKTVVPGDKIWVRYLDTGKTIQVKQTYVKWTNSDEDSETKKFISMTCMSPDKFRFVKVKDASHVVVKPADADVMKHVNIRVIYYTNKDMLINDLYIEREALLNNIDKIITSIY